MYFAYKLSQSKMYKIYNNDNLKLDTSLDRPMVK